MRNFANIYRPNELENHVKRVLSIGHLRGYNPEDVEVIYLGMDCGSLKDEDKLIDYWVAINAGRYSMPIGREALEHEVNTIIAFRKEQRRKQELEEQKFVTHNPHPSERRGEDEARD